MTTLEAAQAAVVRLLAEAVVTTHPTAEATREAAEALRGRLRTALVAWDVEIEMEEMQGAGEP
jgi:hypothetical protein